MSRQSVVVTFPDGTERHGLYNGTADSLWPALFDTPALAWEAKDRFYHAAWEEFSQVFYPDPIGEVHPVLINIDNGTPEIPGYAAHNAVVSPIDAEAIWEAEEALEANPGRGGPDE